MKKYIKNGIRKLFVMLTVISMLLTAFIFVDIKDIYAIEEPVVKENILVESDIVYEKLINNSITNEKNNVRESMGNYTEIISKQKEETVEVRVAVEPVELTIEDKIYNACNTYGITDYYDIVLAISKLETGHFTSNAYLYKNNPGGLSRNEVPMSFSTIEEGVDRFVSNLSNNYISIGLNTVEEIGDKYCPNNPRWAKLVRSVMG